MRAGARGVGETMNGPGGRNRDDLPTLRVTNLSEDTEEADLWGIFTRFQQRGKLHRIYVGTDQVTGLCKGFAFVSFEDKGDAERAMAKVHGWVCVCIEFLGFTELRSTQHAFCTSHSFLSMVCTQGEALGCLAICMVVQWEMLVLLCKIFASVFVTANRNS